MNDSNDEVDADNIQIEVAGEVGVDVQVEEFPVQINTDGNRVEDSEYEWVEYDEEDDAA